MTDLEIKTALNKILMSYADTPFARELVIKNFITNEGSVLDYIIALSDGLKYGNWPWVNNSQRLLNQPQDKSPLQKYFESFPIGGDE